MNQPQHVFREVAGFSGRWKASINTYEHPNYEGWQRHSESMAKLDNVEFYYNAHDTGMKILEMTVDYLDKAASGEEKHYCLMYSIVGDISRANSSRIVFTGTVLKGVIVEAATRKLVEDVFVESENKTPLVDVHLVLKK